MPVQCAPSLIFFDLDGTLINSRHELNRADQEAILKLHKKGVIISIATGRPLFACKHAIQAVNADGIGVFFSGALVCSPDQKTVLTKKTLQPAKILALLEVLESHSFYVELYDSSNYYIAAAHPMAELHSQYLGLAPEVACLTEIVGTHEILKLVVVANNALEYSKLSAILNAFDSLHVAVGYGAANPGLSFFNLTTSTASRQSCFEIILKHYALPPAAVMAFGDGESDIPFLSLAGYGVAMGNASAQVQSQAKYVTKHVDQCGVAHFLERICS